MRILFASSLGRQNSHERKHLARARIVEEGGSLRSFSGTIVTFIEGYELRMGNRKMRAPRKENSQGKRFSHRMVAG